MSLSDDAFAKLLGPIEDTATPGASADATAIDAAAPDATDVPDEDEIDDEEISAEAEDDEVEEEEIAEPETAPEIIPIQDPRHPDHAVYVEAMTARQQRDHAQRLIAEAARVRYQADIQNTLAGLPDADPDQLVPTVTSLIAKVVTPIRQQAEQAGALGEEAAKVATTMHLAMRSVLTPEQIAAVEAERTALAAHPNWQAMEQSVGLKKSYEARESQQIIEMRAELDLLKKQLKARSRPAEADAAGGQGARGTTSSGTRQPGMTFDQWFSETQASG